MRSSRRGVSSGAVSSSVWPRRTSGGLSAAPGSAVTLRGKCGNLDRSGSGAVEALGLARCDAMGCVAYVRAT